MEFSLTTIQHELVKDALYSASRGRLVTSRQRLFLSAICSAPDRENHTPEEFLVAFKSALHNAAVDARIPFGPDREEILSALVSAFIEELFRDQAALGGSPYTPGFGTEPAIGGP
jgi:hypothetical protein